MRRFLACLGIPLFLGFTHMPAEAFPLGQRPPILTPGACANITLNIDFTANDGAGLYCLNGTRYASFLGMPGASFARASIKTCMTSAGVVVTVAAGAPCITDQGILIEEARTNNWRQSQAFDVSPWGKNDVSIVADQALAPDGTVTADAVVEDTSNITHQISQLFNFVASSTNTLSVFVKPGTRTQVHLFFSSTYNTANPGAIFNLTGSGSVASAISGAVATITPAANGFYRISITAPANTANTSANGFILPILNGADTYQGDGSQSLFVWGAQSEAGSFATSYIPTTSVVVTRAGDVASVANPLSGASGTWLAEASQMPSIANIPRFLGFSTSDIGASTNTSPETWNGSSVLIGAAFSGSFSDNINKTVVAFDLTGRSITTNGALPVSDANAGVLSSPVVSIGENFGSSYINTYMKRVSAYGSRLNNSLLLMLTR